VRIKTVVLENIRSHVNSIIEFSDGFNCLIGGLGRGKSSILLAVDFALFGDPLGRSYDYLLREGSDVGKVALKFVKDGRDYTVWRALRRKDNRISQDIEQLKLFEGDNLIAQMKSDAVGEQLKTIIGIDRDLFREVVWMRQEHLKELLDIPPGERQRKLDQLFGLSDYETSWTNLRPVLSGYESEKNTLERDPDIVRIKELQAKYEETAKEFTLKEMELGDLKRLLSAAEVELNEVSARVEALESLRRKNDELRAREAELQAKIMTIEDVSARLADETQEREGRIKGLEERLTSFRNQENTCEKMLEEVGLPRDQTIEQIKRHLDTFISQISSIQGEKESVDQEIRRNTQRISNLAKENRCPLCLQLLSLSYKQDLIERMQEEIDEYKGRLNELESNGKELERMRLVVTSAASNLQMTRTRREEVERQLEEERHFILVASREFQQRQLEEEVARRELVALHKEISEFDITKLQEAQRLRDTAFERYSGVKYALQAVKNQKKEISLRMDGLKERLESAEVKVDRIMKVKRILGIVNDLRGAYRSIQPKLRSEFITYLERIVQQELDELMGLENVALSVKIDENYTPFTESSGGHERSVTNLSGGERTFLAFAYRIGIGQLIMQSRLGHGLSMLLLDEPTESLGREDGSIERLAEAISRLKTIEQVIAVTHSEAFAERADHVMRLEKEDNVSKVSVER